jgi:membrane protein
VSSRQRIGLNRAYGLRERRSFWMLRLESIGFVLVSAIVLLLAFLLLKFSLCQL